MPGILVNCTHLSDSSKGVCHIKLTAKPLKKLNSSSRKNYVSDEITLFFLFDLNVCFLTIRASARSSLLDISVSHSLKNKLWVERNKPKKPVFFNNTNIKNCLLAIIRKRTEIAEKKNLVRRREIRNKQTLSMVPTKNLNWKSSDVCVCVGSVMAAKVVS